MEDSWDWVEDELKKIQDEIPVDSEMMQVVDAISVADFWKRRYDEELMLWERKLDIKEGERKDLQGKAQVHETAIKELDFKLKDLERRWDQEKLLLEDRIKAKEVEAMLEKTKSQWETRLKVIEEENKSLKNQMGFSEGLMLSPQAGTVLPAELGLARNAMEKQLKDLERDLQKTEAESRKRLEKLEAEKQEVTYTLAEKEKMFIAEKEKWGQLENEVSVMSEQMSRQLASLNAREKEHFIILEDLARGFAHRVRNFLGIMSGTVQLCLANYTMQDEFKDQLNIVDQNAQEMLKSIEEFLSLARIPEMSMEAMDISEALENALQGAESKIKAGHINVSKNYSPDIPWCSADKKLFHEMFVNLLQNSVEAMGQGGKLDISTAFDKFNNTVSVKISDTGSGISEMHLKKIFQPYFSSKKGHKGLGITVAKRIIDLHRGTLNVESTKGKGTTVTVNMAAVQKF